MSPHTVDGVVEKRLAHSKVLYLESEDILVDTGPESEWEELQSLIDDRGGVSTLFLSHTHGDHSGNLARVISEYGPNVLVPENEPLEDVQLAEADVTRVTDGESISEDVRVVQVPGHTPGISALYLPSRDTLLATDTLDGSDRRGLPPGYLLPPPALYNWDAKKAETNLEKLLELEFDTAVVTHGSNVETDARQKLDAYLNFPDYYRQELLEG
jgi:glyoxylase-like metal-dependent hydrolase (beta-lactamase superfamily II)